MVAFLTSLIILFALVALIFPMAKRRPVGTPTTWGEAMVAATYTFFIMFWACLLYTSPSPRDGLLSRMPSSA